MKNSFSKFFLKEYKVNAEGGIIYVDQKVKNWLNSFSKEDNHQKSIFEERIFKQITKFGFEENPLIDPPENFPKISLILVLYNSTFWVENLSMMFENLKSYLYEIIIIDNGSKDDCMNLLEERISGCICIKNEKSNSFSTAINQGTRIASGEVFLIINPDIYIPRRSLKALIECYNKCQNAAAISPKLMLMNTPGFINGIGNVVKPFWHGYDMGLGHLDVGQFDHISELPSACFAAILIAKRSWEVIGELDEEFPLYYEDSDWCYRARTVGKRIIFCPQSEIYHAYKASSGNKRTIDNQQIKNITKGRIRFTKKNLNKNEKLFYLFSFFLNDIFNYVKYLLIYKKSFFGSIFFTWADELFFFKKSSNTKKLNSPETKLSKFYVSSHPSVFLGLPVLTSKILNHYKNLL